MNKLAEDVIIKTKKYKDEDLEYSVPKGDKNNANLYKNLEGFGKNNEWLIVYQKKQKDNKTNCGI